MSAPPRMRRILRPRDKAPLHERQGIAIFD
jgi:hypothetical protein